jgi:hypothetical protein
MSQSINLNQFRKAKQAAQKKTKAAENAVKFGRTKAQKKGRTKRAKWPRRAS